ncbi:MAG: SH3 domain-containing protein [Rufibacter sp.]
MPNISCKFYWLFCVAWLSFSQPVLAQPSTLSLQRADSLYKQHHYTQALGIYASLLEKGKVYSPQMLLKMAYIYEGLQNYTQAMYYLQLYYSKYPSRSVLQKMEELGLQQRLTGYAYTDWDFFKTQFYKYYARLLEIMLLLAVGALTLLALRWRNRKPISQSVKIVYLLYLGFLFYFGNYLTLGQQGIITQGNVPIMASPSAGADLITSVGTGHKVNVIGEQDIWYQIEWEDKEAYIRKNNLLLLPQPL